MYVGWHMKTDLVTVSADTPMYQAREIMNQRSISHLPVTDDESHLLGMVSDRDLKEAWASRATTLSVYELTYLLHKVIVKNLMKKEVITATVDMTIERAARIMHDHKIGALPVVQNGKLVGIITTTDLMEVLLLALGMSDASARISVIVTDRIGMLAEVGQVMQQTGVSIRSIMSLPITEYKDLWQLILRVDLEARPRAIKALQDRRFRVLTEYTEDLCAYLREQQEEKPMTLKVHDNVIKERGEIGFGGF
jgi:acetoin utilization protein AcuB